MVANNEPVYTNYYTSAKASGNDMSKPGTKPELSLAFSVHSGPGTYAILLGSGVSSAAGILTGWGVTLDLVRQLAAMHGGSAKGAPPLQHSGCTVVKTNGD